MKIYIKESVSYYKDESDIQMANTLIREAINLLGQFLMTDGDLRRFLWYDRIHDEYVLKNNNFIDSFNEWLKGHGNSDGYLNIGDRECVLTNRVYYPVHFVNNREKFSVGTFIIADPEYKDDGSAADFYFKSWRGAKIKRTYTLGSQYVGEDGKQIRQL